MVFDTVTYLARAYFHQDFDLIAPTPEGVVEEFIVHEDPATTDQLRRELEELTKGHVSEDEMRSAWMASGGSSFDPDRQGISYREWFGRILELLAPAR